MNYRSTIRFPSMISHISIIFLGQIWQNKNCSVNKSPRKMRSRSLKQAYLQHILKLISRTLPAMSLCIVVLPKSCLEKPWIVQRKVLVTYELMFRSLSWLCLNECKARSNCIHDPTFRHSSLVSSSRGSAFKIHQSNINECFFIFLHKEFVAQQSKKSDIPVPIKERLRSEKNSGNSLEGFYSSQNNKRDKIAMNPNNAQYTQVSRLRS